MKTVQVKDLKKGDQVTGGEILANPVPATHPMYGKNKMHVKIKYSNTGKEKVQTWGKYTTITIHNDGKD